MKDNSSNSNNTQVQDNNVLVSTLTGIYGNPTVEGVQRLYREVRVGTVVYALQRLRRIEVVSNPQFPTVDEILQHPHRCTELVTLSLYRLWKLTDTHYHTTQYQREVEPLFLKFPPIDRHIFDRLTSEYTEFKRTSDYRFIMGTLRTGNNSE